MFTKSPGFFQIYNIFPKISIFANLLYFWKIRFYLNCVYGDGDDDVS